ncbi:MFS transporter [Haloarculaceae archaeon H-GB2-1]|nr:MFS transporter [Haloarculaceae archaeon H-GB1-1]MEA5388958.1 MFS transporter [Haloarculaceae archaeon H-GB11]MEA5407015.1 MFS transporter [Haloarculaceae archaeon H-GB2-1]
MATQQGRLFAGYGGRMLVSLSAAWAILQFGRFLLSPLLPAIIRDLGITTATAGVVLGGLQLVYAGTQMASGRLSDQLTRPSLVVPGLVFLTAAFLLVGTAATVVPFALGALVLGFGKGLFTVPSRAQLSDLFDGRRGQALGVYTAGTDLGGILAAVAGVVVAGGSAVFLERIGFVATVSVGWRSPFRFVAAVLAVATVGYVLWNRESYRVGRPTLAFGETFRRLVTTSRQRELLVAFSLFYFVVGAWVNFLPTYLAQSKGFPESLAAGLFAVVFLVGIVVKPLSGLLSDRLSGRLVAAGALLFSVLGLASVSLTSTLVPVVAAIAVYALGYKSVFPIADALLLEEAPTADVGADLGVARGIFIGVGALGPVYMGTVATVATYRVGFVGLALCYVVAAALLLNGYVREG